MKQLQDSSANPGIGRGATGADIGSGVGDGSGSGDIGIGIGIGGGKSGEGAGASRVGRSGSGPTAGMTGAQSHALKDPPSSRQTCTPTQSASPLQRLVEPAVQAGDGSPPAEQAKTRRKSSRFKRGN